MTNKCYQRVGKSIRSSLRSQLLDSSQTRIHVTTRTKCSQKQRTSRRFSEKSSFGFHVNRAGEKRAKLGAGGVSKKTSEIFGGPAEGGPAGEGVGPTEGGFSGGVRRKASPAEGGPGRPKTNPRSGLAGSPGQTKLSETSLDVRLNWMNSCYPAIRGLQGAMRRLARLG